jgi:hypothetical protein
VVGPDDHADDHDCEQGENHPDITEDRLAAESRDHLTDDAEARQDHDVDLRMTEEGRRDRSDAPHGTISQAVRRGGRRAPKKDLNIVRESVSESQARKHPGMDDARGGFAPSSGWARLRAENRCVMPAVNHNAVHEAGHVIAALCCSLDVSAVLIKSTGKYTARCELVPTQAIPRAVYAMKVAGAVAVQIQNEMYGRSDDDGFGKPEDAQSDAYCIERLRLYWMSLNMTDADVDACDNKLRTFVRNALSHYWPIVEALANEIAILTLSGPLLMATRIGEIINALDPAFYNQVKANLVTMQSHEGT